MKYTLGALKPKIDGRDYKIKSTNKQFPEYWSYNELTPIKNQGEVSSCVAHAASTILEMLNKTETGKFKPLSTDFIYGMQSVEYNRKDTGMYLRDACKIIQNYGDAYETTIPSNTEQPVCGENLKSQLNDSIIAEAAQHRIKSYAKCKTEEDIKYALMNYGPLLISIKWYDKNTFENNKIIMDKSSPSGNHAVVLYGWGKVGWLCQNSWGHSWNRNGRFIYPYSEKIREAWALIDTDNNTAIHMPKSKGLWKYLYRIFNFFANLFR